MTSPVVRPADASVADARALARYTAYFGRFAVDEGDGQCLTHVRHADDLVVAWIQGDDGEAGESGQLRCGDDIGHRGIAIQGVHAGPRGHHIAGSPVAERQ